MKYLTPSLIIAACIAASGCTSDSQNLTSEKENEIRVEITKQIDDLRGAWANLDAPAVVSFYSERSIDTYNGERGPYAEMVDWAAVGYTDITGTDIGPFEDFRVDVLSEHAAVASWHNSVIETSTASPDSSKYKAFMTQVWIREGNDWRILHNHESTIGFE